eukprot:TRINITY_DN1421_c0_g2_i1.p1 TRINITY_DN1421_c0_g2~~TRINITY_DN1421_c0_g2_i1.p1  ORF type:complete len:274 (+),score=62.36 TRINITY_DN1421_c0_g2_i1:94-822(+)
MVLPMPAGTMGPQMQGPLPEGSRSRIKKCVMVMIVSFVAKLIAGTFLFGPFIVLSASLNLLLNTLIGIFMLSDDVHLGKIHAYLMRSCFRSCEQNCQTGLSCLMPFVMCNFITVIMDILFGNTFSLISSSMPIIFKPESWPNLSFGVFFSIFVFSSLFAIIAQIVAMYAGWAVMKDIGGFDGGGGGAFGGPQNAGGGYQPPSYQPSQPAQQQGSRPGFAASRPPQQQTFQPFGGAGHTLGSR